MKRVPRRPLTRDTFFSNNGKVFAWIAANVDPGTLSVETTVANVARDTGVVHVTARNCIAGLERQGLIHKEPIRAPRSKEVSGIRLAVTDAGVELAREISVLCARQPNRLSTLTSRGATGGKPA